MSFYLTIICLNAPTLRKRCLAQMINGLSQRTCANNRTPDCGGCKTVVEAQADETPLSGRQSDGQKTKPMRAQVCLNGSLIIHVWLTIRYAAESHRGIPEISVKKKNTDFMHSTMLKTFHLEAILSLFLSIFSSVSVSPCLCLSASVYF